MTVVMETWQFAADQVTKVLDRLAFQIGSAIKSYDADGIRNLRVSIRRCSRVLIVFKPCFDRKAWKRIRRRLKDTMALAGDVRDCDAAIRLLPRSRIPEIAALRRTFQARRRGAAQELLSSLRRWVSQRLSSRWRHELKTSRAAQRLLRQPAEDIARRELAKTAKRFLQRGEQAASGKATARDLRLAYVAARKFHNTLELFAPIYGAAVAGWLERIGPVLKTLDHIDDCRIARSMASKGGGNRRVDAALKRKQHRMTQEFHRLWGELSIGVVVPQWPARKPMARASQSARVARSSDRSRSQARG